MTNPNWPTEPFLVALSYPSEERDFVEKVAIELGENIGRKNVFYDRWYEADLAGQAGDLKLAHVYKKMSTLVVPFFSKHYQKPWCKHEWDSIRSMLHERQDDDSILAIKMDNSEISGWHEIDFHINPEGRSAIEIAEIILKKLARLIEPSKQPNNSSNQLSTKSSDQKKPLQGVIEQNALDVEITSDNSVNCPSYDIGIRALMYFSLVFLVFFMLLIFKTMGTKFSWVWAWNPVLFEIPFAIIFLFFLLIPTICIKLYIKELFSSCIILSTQHIVLYRRIPRWLARVFFIQDRITRLKSDSLWWDFDKGNIAMSDGTTNLAVYMANELIEKEKLHAFENELTSKMKLLNISFKKGKPPRVRFHDGETEID